MLDDFRRYRRHRRRGVGAATVILVRNVADVAKRFEASVHLPQIEVLVKLVLADVVAAIGWLLVVSDDGGVFGFNWNKF